MGWSRKRDLAVGEVGERWAEKEASKDEVLGRLDERRPKKWRENITHMHSYDVYILWSEEEKQHVLVLCCTYDSSYQLLVLN